MSRVSFAKKLIKSDVGLTLFLMKIRGTTLVIKFLSNIYIAHFLGFEALGLYGLIVAGTILVPSVVGLNLMFSVTRNAVTAPRETVISNVFYYLKYLIIVYTILAIIAVSYGFMHDKHWLYLLICLIIFFEHINNNIYELQHNLSKHVSANIIHFIRNAIWVLLYMLIAYFIPNMLNIEMLLVFWMMGSILSFVCFLVDLRALNLTLVNNKQSLVFWVKENFRISQKAYLNGLLDAPSIYLDRYFLTLFIGLEQTGIFVFFWSIISAISNLISSGAIQVARPKMVKSFHNKDSDYNSIYKKCLKQVIILSLILSLTSILIIKLYLIYFDSDTIQKFIWVYYIMVISFLIKIISEVMKLHFYAQHRDDLTLILGIEIILISVTCNFLLIWQFGMLGACLSIFIISCANCILRRLYYNKLEFNFNNHK